jgi:cephalosporin hydroxylase
MPDDVVARFHELYYNSWESGGTWNNTSWFGVKTQKCPLDMWIYQEILHTQHPELIVETGTANGGSALFLAMMCDLLGSGEIVTIDIEERPGRPTHPRIRYLHGSSTAPEVVEQVRGLAKGRKGVLVILDSDHSKKHVLGELRAYADLVTPGGYLIVEDTNVNGHPVVPAFGPGPFEAVEEFLSGRQDFEIDKACEKYFMTFNPSGYLRKKR